MASSLPSPNQANQAPSASQASGAWRPPQWQQGTGATLTITAVQATSRQTPSSTATLPSTAGAPSTQQPTVMYVFDGAIRADHVQDMTLTQNPVQTGVALADHSYLLPARLTVEIAMSDSMQSYVVG